MKRHGYKGAFELAATVDYMFGYDATAQVIEDWMYEDVTESYVLDPDTQRFFQQSNPWALKGIVESAAGGHRARPVGEPSAGNAGEACSRCTWNSKPTWKPGRRALRVASNPVGATLVVAPLAGSSAKASKAPHKERPRE